MQFKRILEYFINTKENMYIPIIYSRLGKRTRHSRMCDNHYYKNAFMLECRVTFKKKL